MKTRLRLGWCWGNWIIGVSFDYDLFDFDEGEFMRILHIFPLSIIWDRRRTRP